MKKRVLIIEDDLQMCSAYLRALSDHLEVLIANTLDEAHRAFHAAETTLDAIAVDGAVPGVKLNTDRLVRHMRKTYGGLIIAISGDDRFNRLLLDAGCNEACATKSDLVPRLLTLA